MKIYEDIYDARLDVKFHELFILPTKLQEKIINIVLESEQSDVINPD